LKLIQNNNGIQYLIDARGIEKKRLPECAVATSPTKQRGGANSATVAVGYSAVGSHHHHVLSTQRLLVCRLSYTYQSL